MGPHTCVCWTSRPPAASTSLRVRRYQPRRRRWTSDSPAAPLLTGGPASANNLANWQLLKDGVDVTSSIVGINYKSSQGWFSDRSSDPRLSGVRLAALARRVSLDRPGHDQGSGRWRCRTPRAPTLLRNFRVLGVSADSGVKTVEKVERRRAASVSAGRGHGRRLGRT